MKKQFLLWFGLLAGLFSYSQSVNYKVLLDDPYDIKKIALHLDPFYVDTWGAATSIGFGFRADAILGRLATGYIDYRKAYLDLNYTKNAPDSYHAISEKLKKQNYFELGGALHLVERTKTKNLKVVLSSSSSSSGGKTYTTTKYIMVPGTIRKVISVRAGIIKSRAPIEIEETPLGGAVTNIYNGLPTVVNGVNKTNANDIINFGLGGTVLNGTTTLNTYAIFGGISSKSITNLLIDTDFSKKGKRGHAKIWDIYGDVIFAPVVGFKDVIYQGKTYELDGFDIKRIGWRAGLSFRGSAKNFMSFKFEFGSRPGYAGKEEGYINNPNNFIMMTIGWSIPIKIKAIDKVGTPNYTKPI